MTVAIRAAVAGDFQAIYAINQSAIPDVSSVTPDELQSLVKQCCYFGVAVVDGEVAGFLMALRPGQSYQSVNYRWFSDRYKNFVYIDRIAVAPAYKGRGIGRALYADLESLATAWAPILTCEVNVDPPNADSMAFHTKLGFAEVGQQDTEGGTKRVSLMVKTAGPECVRRPISDRHAKTNLPRLTGPPHSSQKQA